MTLPEVMLWQQLRGTKLGLKVRRQHPIGPYVVDFYVSAIRLVTEIDGESHNRADNPTRDESRDGYLRGQGYQVLRVPAVDVLNRLGAVLEGIAARVTNPLHHPWDGPPPRPGEDSE